MFSLNYLEQTACSRNNVHVLMAEKLQQELDSALLDKHGI